MFNKTVSNSETVSLILEVRRKSCETKRRPLGGRYVLQVAGCRLRVEI